MEHKLALLWPEIAMFATTCLVLVLGLSRTRLLRQSCALVCGVGLLVAGVLAVTTTPAVATALPNLPLYAKLMVAAVGLVLTLLMAGSADRELEAEVSRGAKFDPIRSVRAEFWAFYMFSLTGLMLCCSADDLIWLFLALELTSLPTYVMVAISTRRNRSMEAAVKYFFLGALGAAIFLYGFALIYGGTGSTSFLAIRDAIALQASAAGGGEVNPLVMLGLVLALVGVSFKIAAVPMHFYTPDVYEGSSASMAGFLAFVPKAAGMLSILALCSMVGWRFSPAGSGTTTLGAAAGLGGEQLPDVLRVLLIVLAVLTMTIGNVLAIMQHSIKRILAYSSIAHSGYMLVGVIAGPGPAGSDFTRNGVSAVLFYLFCYGIMTIGAFSVVACLEKKSHDPSGEETVEADDVDDLKGLVQTRPVLGWTMVISSMGLLGLPPLLGFFGKLPLFTAAIGAGEIPLVLILGLNSAIAAYYYLRLAYVCFVSDPERVPNAPAVVEGPFTPRKMAGVVSMVCVVALAIGGSRLTDWATLAGTYQPAVLGQGAQQATPAVELLMPVAQTRP